MRPVYWLLGGLVAGLGLAALVLYVAASTGPGQEWVLRFTLDRLGRSLQGRLVIERVSGNLLTGARLYGIRLTGPDGVPFVVADSADLDYDIRTLLTARIHIEDVTLYQPQVLVRRMPGDSLWNYEEIFRDTSTVKRPPGPERHTYLDSIRLVNARARVQLPWEPTPGLSARAARREVAEVLSDTSTILVQRAPGGYLRTVNFTALNGRVSHVRFAPGTPQGTYLRVDSLGGFAQIFRAPVRITDLRGEMLVLPEQVQFHAPLVQLRSSRLGAAGTLRFPPEAEQPLYDVAILGQDVAFRDLRWLYPRFPGDARGSLTLLVESRSPDGKDVLFLARNADIRAPGTHVTGDFGMILGDTLRFVDVNLRAKPLRVATLEAMLPQKLPVVGLHIGSAEIRGSSGGTAEADKQNAAAAKQREGGDPPAAASPPRPARAARDTGGQ